MTSVPQQARHYHRAVRPPFLNLSDLPQAELEGVVGRLIGERRSGTHRRAFGRQYMELRRRTEGRMRALFVEAGGEPERIAPHYFVLGESRWFEGLADDMCSVALDLTDLPESVTSFTYPDSLTAMGFTVEYGLPYEAKPYHDQVYRLTQLAAVVERFGLPEDPVGGYEGYEHRPFEMYVEIQLWSDAPIAHLLESARHPRDEPAGVDE